MKYLEPDLRPLKRFALAGAALVTWYFVDLYRVESAKTDAYNKVVSQLHTAPLDKQIDDWVLKGKAYVDCRGLQPAAPKPSTTIHDWLRDTVKNDKCRVRYGRPEPPMCFYGPCP